MSARALRALEDTGCEVVTQDIAVSVDGDESVPDAFDYSTIECLQAVDRIVESALVQERRELFEQVFDHLEAKPLEALEWVVKQE